MRIHVAGYNYAPEPTGIGRYSGELCAWLVAQGHDVIVVTAVPHYPTWRRPPGYGGVEFRTETVDGVTVRRVPVMLPNDPERVTTGDRMRLEASFAVASLVAWLRLLFAKRPDVVIAVVPPGPASLFTLAYARIRRAPLVVHVQDLQAAIAGTLGMVKEGRALRIARWVERTVCARAHKTTTVSTSMARELHALGVDKDRIEVVPNWCSLQASQQEYDPSAVRRSLDLPVDQPLIMHMGNVGEKQALDVVIDAIARFEHDVTLAIVGHGAAVASLREQASRVAAERVRFLPVQPEERLGEVLRCADLQLVTQRSDVADLVMPSKLTNILAASMPVVVTATPESELGRVVRDADCGWIAPPDDPVELASTIASALAASADEREQKGVRGRRWAEANIDRDVVLTRFEAILQELVAR